MAKISKIRFINFTYNDNRHIYDQTLDFYNGEDTLLNLQNGGGKTVLVQMMMQPIIPKQRLKDRLFKSYFKNTKAPVYIMIEWILDDSSKKVMTGIGIKRVLGKTLDDDSDNLRVVTFMSEYEQESSFDIKNISLLEEERGMVRLIDFEKVLKSLSNAEKEGSPVWLFRWDLADDKKEYTRRLLNYKINQMEWKNLMVRINEAEAGLNSFFNDCKTNNALIKKWFIPTIEEQLNKNGNFVENIKELIKNHTEQLVKNEDMLKEREIFESFQRKSQDLVKHLEDYGVLLTKSEENKTQLGNAVLFVQASIKGMEEKREELLTCIKGYEEKMKELTYEKLSGEYHQVADHLERLTEEVSQLDKEMNRNITALEELEFKQNQLQCAQLSEELKSLNGRVAKFETELEKENLQKKDIKKLLLDIEYSLKEKYKKKIVDLENTIHEGEKHVTDKKHTLSKHEDEIDGIKVKITALQDEIIALRGRIAVFDENEGALKSAYPDVVILKNSNAIDFDPASIELVKSRLEDEGAEIETRRQLIVEKRAKDQLEIDALDTHLRELRSLYPTLVIEKNAKEAELLAFENESKALYKILKSYELSETCLFQHDKINLVLQEDKGKYNQLIHDKSLENAMLKKQLKLYEAGKAFELSDEVKKTLEDQNIFVEFGYEWLRDLHENKNSKLKLVKNNPFLPYSLIVSQKDLKRMQDTAFKAALSPIIPVFVREQLEKSFAVQSRNNIHSIENVDFLIAFDDRILNKNYLKETCEEITATIGENDTMLLNAQNALKNIALYQLKIEGFSYKEADVQSLTEGLQSICSQMKENEKWIKDNEDKIAFLKQDISKQLEGLTHLDNEKARFKRKKQDVEGFIARCKGHSMDLSQKKQREEQLKSSKILAEEQENEVTKIKAQIKGEELKLTNLIAALEQDQGNYERYKDSKLGKFLDEDIETLESKRKVYTSEYSGKIQSLQDILEDYKKQRNEKQKKLDELGLKEHQYMGLVYSSGVFDSYQEAIAKAKLEHKKISEDKNTLLYQIAERNSDLKYMAKSILEQCSQDNPKPKEAIRDMDFEQEKSLVKKDQKAVEKELAGVKQQENKLLRIKFGLEEFAGYVSKVTEIQEIEADLDGYVLKHIKEHKEFVTLTQDVKLVLTSLYNDLESVFISKAEVFKNLFHSILDGEKRYQPIHAHNAFNRVYIQIDRKLEQYAVDIQKIDNMENCIIDNTLSYLKNVYDEMNQIDRNSTIEVDGKRCKMLIISLPEKEELENLALKEYLRHTILNCVSLYKQGKSVEGLLSNEIATYDLFDRLVSIKKVEIHLMKIEPNRLKKKTWKQVIEENSGGEKFVSAFVVFISLLTYMRGENYLKDSMDSKVLIMDNPFGPITSEHLLKPLFEISKKYNTQLICLTDLKEHTIFDRFNLIYSLNVEREVGREDEYIELKTIKKDITLALEEDEILSASMFKIEDKSRFELMN